MLQIKAKLLAIIVCCFLIACDAHISENKEPVFNNFKPESKEYRNKLAEKLVNSKEELVYVFQNYIDDNTIEIIVSGESFAANCFVKVNDWKNMQGIRQAKGGGYRHAELMDFKVHIIPNPKGAIFVFKDLGRIID